MQTLLKSKQVRVGVFVTWNIFFVCVAPQVKYTTNPAIMAKVISNCLREERRILSSACMQEQVCHSPSQGKSLWFLNNRCCR